MSSKRWRGWARARAKMTQLPQAAAVKENGAEVASDGFKLEIPAGAMQLMPGQVPELNEIPALFSAKGGK